MKGALVVLIASTLLGSVHLSSRLGLDIPLDGDVDKTFESKDCGFHGYSPYFKPSVLKAKHYTAHLQTSMFQDDVTSEEFTIAMGTMTTLEESEFIEKSAEFIKKNLKNIKARDQARVLRTLTVVNDVVGAVGGMAPVLGTFCAIFGAIQGVQTPTHADILAATNKALDKIVNEVDNKIAELQGYVDEKFHESSKKQAVIRYKFLVTYWSICSWEPTEEERMECQKRALQMGYSSYDQFLPYNDLLLNDGTFGSMDDEKRRSIEVSMLPFRDYAVWFLRVLKSITGQYRIAYEMEFKDKKDQKRTCEDVAIQEAKEQHIAVSDRKSINTNLRLWCAYKEKLVARAVYFEKYAVAAIDEIRTLSKNRLKKELTFDQNDVIKGEHSAYNAYPKFEVQRIACGAKIHPSKHGKCRYDVQLVTLPTPEEWDETVQDSLQTVVEHFLTKRITWVTNKDKIDKTLPFTEYEDLRDNELIEGDIEGRVEGWCKGRIKKRHREYLKMELFELDRYWAIEVLKPLKCARLLHSGEIKECSDDTIKKYVPKAVEAVIGFKKGAIRKTGSGTSKETTADKAIDGLLSTTSLSTPATQNTPSKWSAEFEEPAYVTKVHVFTWEKAKKEEGAVADFHQVHSYDKYIAQKKDAKGVKLDDGNFIFAWNNKGYKKMVLTDNKGKTIKAGWIKLNELNGASNNNWKNPKNWKEEKSNGNWGYYVKKFTPISKRGSYEDLEVVIVSSDDQEKPTKCSTTGATFPKSYDEPLIFHCEETEKPQKLVEISLGLGNNEQKLYLAEVRVIGVLADADDLTDLILTAPTKDSPTQVVFEEITQSSYPSGTDSRLLAVDTFISTMSRTEEKSSATEAWLEAKLKSTSKSSSTQVIEHPRIVDSITVFLYGSYSNVRLQIKLENSSAFKTCGAAEQKVQGDSVKGFTRSCTTASGNTKAVAVRVIATPQPDENGKSSLKIRELQVRAL